MARINVEDEFWTDPRFTSLVVNVGCKLTAVGMVITAWRLAQHYWKDGKQLIPEKAWKGCKLKDELMEVGFAERRSNGIYVSGTEKHFEWYHAGLAQRSRAGKLSAQIRKRKFGSAQPHKIVPESPNGLERAFERTRTDSNGLEPSSSSSSSLSNNIKHSSSKSDARTSSTRSAIALAPNIGSLIGTYVSAWQSRWGTKARPDVGGKSQGILKRLVANHPPEQIAVMLQVYCQMTDPWFVKKVHDLATFEQNFNKVSLALDKGRAEPTQRTWEDIAKEQEENDRARVQQANGKTLESVAE